MTYEIKNDGIKHGAEPPDQCGHHSQKWQALTKLPSHCSPRIAATLEQINDVRQIGGTFLADSIAVAQTFACSSTQRFIQALKWLINYMVAACQWLYRDPQLDKIEAEVKAILNAFNTRINTAVADQAKLKTD